MKINQIIQFLFGITMLIFAYLQVNDPDPFLWVLIYVLVALTLVLSALGKRNRYAFWGLVLVIAIPMGFLIQGFFQWLMYEPAEDLLYGMSPDRMYIEESREFLGLFIALLFLIPVYVQLRKDTASSGE